MLRIGLVFGLAATFAFAAGLFLPLPPLNFLLAFVSVLALGWGAGYTAAKTTGTSAGAGIGRGATAGALAGGVVLVISVLVFLLLANTPFVRDLFREVLQQNPGIVDPNTGEPTSVDPTIAALIGGAGGGFCLGLINLILMFVGGAVGGMLWRGVPSVANTGAGAYSGTSVAESDSGARTDQRPTSERP